MNNSAEMRAFSRRQFIALMTGLICVPLFRSCGTEDQPITVGLHIWPGYEPTPLARSMGWLNEDLVKLVQTDSATESLYKGLVLPDLENNIRLLATSQPVLLKSAIIIADTMLKAGILHRPADLTGLLHPEYLPLSDQ